VKSIKDKILGNNFGIIALIVVPIFFISLFVTKKLILSFFVFIILFALVYFQMKWDDNRGVKRHKTIIDSDGFRRFLSKGFKVEKYNNYIGITGVYDGYICDIYYDWMILIKSNITKGILINIYFISPKPIHEYNNANYDFIMEMKEKHKVSRWSFKNHDFDWQEGALMVKLKVGFKNPSYEIIEEALKTGIEIVKQENLNPIIREELMHIRNDYPYQSIPRISMYYN
jgi:hypothetical protein